MKFFIFTDEKNLCILHGQVFVMLRVLRRCLAITGWLAGSVSDVSALRPQSPDPTAQKRSSNNADTQCGHHINPPPPPLPSPPPLTHTYFRSCRWEILNFPAVFSLENENNHLPKFPMSPPPASLSCTAVTLVAIAVLPETTQNPLRKQVHAKYSSFTSAVFLGFVKT